VVRAFYRLTRAAAAKLHSLATNVAATFRSAFRLNSGREETTARLKAAATRRAIGVPAERRANRNPVAQQQWRTKIVLCAQISYAAKEPPMPEVDLQIAAAHAQTIAKSQRKEAQGRALHARPERRRDRRHKTPRQVWIQAMDANGKLIEEVQVMRDYSRGGFYFVSSLHCYCVGMHVHVIPSFGSLNLEFVAEIVRVEPKPKMAYGIGVKLLHARDPIAPQNPVKAQP
jgi:hypothetical protein